MDCSQDLKLADLKVPNGNGLGFVDTREIQESQFAVCDTSSKTVITPQVMKDIKDPFLNSGHFVVNAPSFWKYIAPITNGKETILHSKFINKTTCWTLSSGNFKINVWDLNNELVFTMSRRIEYWDIGDGYNARIKRMIVKHEPTQTKLGYFLQCESQRFLYQMFDDDNTLLYNVERFIKENPEVNFYTVMKPDGTTIGSIAKTNWERRDLRIKEDLSSTHKIMLVCLSCYLQRIFEADEEYFI